MKFTFATAGRIFFGVGEAEEQGPALSAVLGPRWLAVCGGHPDRHARWAQQLAARPELHWFAVAGEPSVVTIEAGLEAVRACAATGVLAIGGGSAIDAAKAIAALAGQPGPWQDHLEIVGRGLPLLRPGLPCAALPTTAGTGAEVTRNSVILVPEKYWKVSLRHDYLLPRLVIVDPMLTLGLPPEITAATGLDALTQLIEPYTTPSATPITDSLCREAIPRAARALPLVCREGSHLAGRTDMAFASLCGGLALANAKLGAVHGLAAVLGGVTGISHGEICARLLPEVTAANIRKLRQSNAQASALLRYAEIAQWVTCEKSAGAEELVVWLRNLLAELPLPVWRGWRLESSAYPTIAVQAQKASSMQGNPVALSQQELVDILERTS